MTDITEITQEQEAFLLPHLPQHTTSQQRPHVTLTYAQSLDGMISLGPGLRTTLSGPESKSMTHFLRQKHDAILIGGGTAKADNPSLNCRYPDASEHDQPRPILASSSISKEWLETCKATDLASQGKAKHPWIVCVADGTESWATLRLKRRREDGNWAWDDNRLVLDMPTNAPDYWKLMFEGLHQRGIKSVMVEGGGKIIGELLCRMDMVDSVIVTIAPTWLGSGGVRTVPPGVLGPGGPESVANLREVKWCQFGQDMVVAGRLEGHISYGL